MGQKKIIKFNVQDYEGVVHELFAREGENLMQCA